MSRIIVLKSKSGEGYVDLLIGLLVIMLMLALAVNVIPVLSAKLQGGVG